MHEIAIAHQLIKKAEQQGDVISIKVEVGELASISAEDLKELLTTITKWKISVVKKNAVVKCRCKFTGEPRIIRREHDLVLFVCPKCSNVPEVVSGRDVIIKEVVVNQPK